MPTSIIAWAHFSRFFRQIMGRRRRYSPDGIEGTVFEKEKNLDKNTGKSFFSVPSVPLPFALMPFLNLNVFCLCGGDIILPLPSAPLGCPSEIAFSSFVVAGRV